MFKINLRDEFLIINLLLLLLILTVIFLPSSALHIVLGIPFLIFFPGYTLLSALFPRKTGIDTIERIALSFGLSIIIAPLLLLFLNYTPWGIRLEPVLYIISSFIFVLSTAGWFRRRRLTEAARFSLSFQLNRPDWGRSVFDRVLLIILAIAILSSIGMVGYVITKPKTGQSFTEFYILDLNGKTPEQPQKMALGEEANATIVIDNHEHERVTYCVEVRFDGMKIGEAGPIVLDDEQQWNEVVSFTPDKAGSNQKVEFLLYKNDETEPYLKPLQLWVDVVE